MTLKKERRCNGCNLTLPYSEFRKRSGETATKEGRAGVPYGRCRLCMRKQKIKEFNGSVENQLKQLCWGSGKRIRKSIKLQEGRDQHLTPEILKEIYDKQEGRCALSGVKMTAIRGKGQTQTNISVDRIDSSIGYLPSNIQLVCVICNFMKSTMTEADLLWWCRNISKHLGRRKPSQDVDY